MILAMPRNTTQKVIVSSSTQNSRLNQLIIGWAFLRLRDSFRHAGGGSFVVQCIIHVPWYFIHWSNLFHSIIIFLTLLFVCSKPLQPAVQLTVYCTPYHTVKSLNCSIACIHPLQDQLPTLLTSVSDVALSNASHIEIHPYPVFSSLFHYFSHIRSLKFLTLFITVTLHIFSNESQPYVFFGFWKRRFGPQIKRRFGPVWYFDL